MAYFEFVHNLGLHSWDIPALITLLLIVVVGVVHSKNQKKREADFEDEMKELIQEADKSRGTYSA